MKKSTKKIKEDLALIDRREARRVELLKEFVEELQHLIAGGNPYSDAGTFIEAGVEEQIDNEENE